VTPVRSSHLSPLVNACNNIRSMHVSNHKHFALPPPPTTWLILSNSEPPFFSLFIFSPFLTAANPCLSLSQARSSHYALDGIAEEFFWNFLFPFPGFIPQSLTGCWFLQKHCFCLLARVLFLFSFTPSHICSQDPPIKRLQPF